MRENKLLNELVKDCIMYKLTETEALDYIKARYGKPISIASYNRRKAIFRSDNRTNLWMNHFTRIGFVKNHKQHIEHIETILNDSMRQFFIEANRPNRDEFMILKIKASIMECTKLLSELDLGTPIIAAIKQKLEQKANESIQTR